MGTGGIVYLDPLAVRPDWRQLLPMLSQLPCSECAQAGGQGAACEPRVNAAAGLAVILHAWISTYLPWR